MILNKIFHFMKGYVIINITGQNIERFLYISARRDIPFFGFGRQSPSGMAVYAPPCVIDKLIPVCEKTGCHIRIIKKCGLPFIIKKLIKRRAPVISFLITAAVFFMSSFFIWSVEISGDDPYINEALIRALPEAGIRIGAFRPALLPPKDIKKMIQNSTDGITWVWVYIKGTKAVVEYKEGTPAPKIADRSVPTDIIAAKDGVLTKVTAKNGRAEVSSGDTVMKGDRLITGSLSFSGGETRSVHAQGEVLADTWYEKSRDYSLKKEIFRKTGKKKSLYSVKIFSKCFDLFFSDSCPYENYSVSEKLYGASLFKNNYTGIGVYKKTYHQTVPYTVTLSEDDVIAHARDELEKEIAMSLLPGSQINNRDIKTSSLPGGNINVTVLMSFCENIGKEVPISSDTGA